MNLEKPITSHKLYFSLKCNCTSKFFC